MFQLCHIVITGSATRRNRRSKKNRKQLLLLLRQSRIESKVYAEKNGRRQQDVSYSCVAAVLQYSWCCYWLPTKKKLLSLYRSIQITHENSWFVLVFFEGRTIKTNLAHKNISYREICYAGTCQWFSCISFQRTYDKMRSNVDLPDPFAPMSKHLDPVARLRFCKTQLLS